MLIFTLSHSKMNEGINPNNVEIGYWVFRHLSAKNHFDPNHITWCFGWHFGIRIFGLYGVDSMSVTCLIMASLVLQIFPNVTVFLNVSRFWYIA